MPQSQLLNPTIFNIFNNDLLEHSEDKNYLEYVDDLIFICDNIEESHSINDSLERW